ncbi:hypothetical protein [Helicobacter himalayensis]|uniref:hypothetical protein n=1 Tax=Helicobacter himalayensis TaxID=1591088 RepID=UPI000A7D539E|nr:hypothetical protein [Helicobacter himalayensis]
MKKISFLLLFCTSLYALPLHKIEGKCVQPKDFSKTQKQVILKAFKYGLPSGYAYTMAAIAWKESCAGEYKVNFADPSAGIYHAHIPGVIKKNKQKDTSFMRNMVGELLIRDDDYASQVALDELLYWGKVRDWHWQQVVKSYNKGFSWEKDKERDKMAQEYFEDIAKRVRILQEYMPKVASTLNKQALKKDHAIIFLENSKQNAMLLRQVPIRKGGTDSIISTPTAPKNLPKPTTQTPAKTKNPQKALNPNTKEFFLLQE